MTLLISEFVGSIVNRKFLNIPKDEKFMFVKHLLRCPGKVIVVL